MGFTRRHRETGPWALVGIILLVAIALALYPRPRSEAADDGVTEVMMWTPPGEFQDSARLVMEEFHRRRPDIRVVVGTATTRDTSGDPTRFLLGVAGDVPPDIILFDRFAIVEWASRGAFLSLNRFIEKEQPDDPLAVLRENFYPPSWDEAVYQGHNYAIAQSADTRALFFNHNSLVRAGFVYTAEDAAVERGDATVGAPRPPTSWEEINRKKLHATGNASADGRVSVSAFVRRPGVNTRLEEDAVPDLNSLDVRPGDIVVLRRERRLFRARIARVDNAGTFQIDFARELGEGTTAVPSALVGECEVRIFDGNSYLARLSRFDPRSGILTEAGFIPLFGNSFFYLYGWQNGGEFVSQDGAQITLTEPPIVEALQWVTDVYDAMGGQEMVTYVQSVERGGVQGSSVFDPFLRGRVAMRVDTNYFLRDILFLTPDLDFGVAPMPLPERELARGIEPFGWGGGWAYAIPSTSKVPEAAWEVIRWIASDEANRLLTEYERSITKARGQQFFPPLAPDRRTMEWLINEVVGADASLPRGLVRAYATFAELMPSSRYRPVTPVGQQLWQEQIRAADQAITHRAPPEVALLQSQQRVQRALDTALAPPRGTPINWRALVAVYTTLVFAIVAGIIIAQEKRRRREGGNGHRRWIEGYLCAMPWLIGFVVFQAGPILFSLVISFSSYDILNPARFTGLENYRALMAFDRDPESGALMARDPLFWKSLGNTMFMVILLPLQIVIGLGIAMLLDTRVRGLGIYRTLYYLPAMVPAVAGFLLWLWLFDPGRGLVNQLLLAVGVRNPPLWIDDPSLSKPSMIVMLLWGVGASMIIWLAGLKDIPRTLYEAAEVDGASPVQRFITITIPMLTPYILFNLIIGLIAIFQLFEPAYIMTDGGPSDSTFFFAYKLFDEAFRLLNMGTASAMAWILFVAALLVTLLQLWFSRRWVYYGGE